jgi:hypothetical protein
MSKQAYPLLALTIVAAAPLTKHRFVTHAGAVPAAAARALGVSRTDALANDPTTVDVLGTAIVEAGAPFALGAQLEIDGTNRAITKASGVVVASALQAALAAGDLVEVVLIPN